MTPGRLNAAGAWDCDSSLPDAGPLECGRRLGLRLITPENRAGYLDGQQARELLMPAGTPATFLFVSHRLVVMLSLVRFLQ